MRLDQKCGYHANGNGKEEADRFNYNKIMVYRRLSLLIDSVDNREHTRLSDRVKRINTGMVSAHADLGERIWDSGNSG